MDSKKIIQKLIKIAENQQKIINKLAQALPATGKTPAPAPELAPQKMEPTRTQKLPAKAILDALDPVTRQTVVNIEERGDDMMVGFKPNQKTQKNYDAVLNTMKKLTDSNVLQRAYTLKAV